MQFSRITSFVDLQIWNATSDGFFVRNQL